MVASGHLVVTLMFFKSQIQDWMLQCTYVSEMKPENHLYLCKNTLYDYRNDFYVNFIDV